MWIVCSETINLGGGKFIAPDKKVQVPDVMGNELIAKSVALEIETEPSTTYVASQQGKEANDEADEEVVEDVEATATTAVATDATATVDTVVGSTGK